jgi:endonuclease/exonuclease/phosphatase family metal-dependent hydrolase
MHHMSILSALLIALLIQSGEASASNGPGNATVRMATWNLEWLIAPREFRELAATCLPRNASPGNRERYIPCNVADELQRSEADFRALRRVAEVLDADVVALQEVDGPAAARKVFPKHQFCFTKRPGVQNNGFAIRRGIPFRCEADVESLSLGGRVRSGAHLVLYPNDPRETHLLSVHLKSGCPRRPLDDTRRDCATLAKQVPLLEAWIDEQAAANRRFAILGDFNHDFSIRGPARTDDGTLRNFWAEIDDGEPAGAKLVNVSSGERFVNCSAAQNYGSYIDHVVLGERLAAERVPGSFIRTTFDEGDALKRKLSDHCPIGIEVSLAP